MMMGKTRVLYINPSLSIDVVSKDIKNLHLSVYPPTGRVRIASPIGIDDETIRLFAISKIAWIRKNQRKFESQKREPQRQFKNRESHYFQGKRYLLRVTEHDAPSKVIIKTKTYIDLYVRPNSTLEQRQSTLNEWYRAELKLQIEPLIVKWSKKLKVEVADWQVKQMKTKWGTCNIEKKRILLNLELAKKPLHCLEYVIVHELLHLIVRHHNDKFLALLDKHMPQWKFVREELNSLPASHKDWDY